MSTEGKFQPGDRIFAKIKGYPAWPARVNEQVGSTGKLEQYKIYFYGSYESGFVKSDQMFLYTPETKSKYGKPQRKNRFKEAMEEIEKDLKIDDDGLVLEEAADSQDDDDEGELFIDEGPSQPPVLKREVNLKNPPAKVEAEVTPVAKPKRVSKSAKRDSITNSTPTPVISTPVPEVPQQTEIVSRSGRKIKPKRFADDEIASPVTPVAKLVAPTPPSSSHDESGELDGPPAKRSKRVPKQTAKVVAQAKAEVEKPAKVTPVKGKVAPQRQLSPDISSPLPKVTPKSAKTGKAAAKVTPVPPQRAGRGRPPIVKPVPIVEDEEEEEEEEEQMENDLLPTESMEVDKENSKGSWGNEMDDEGISNDSGSKSVSEEPVTTPTQSKGGNVQVIAKNGLGIELTFGNDCPKLESQEERRAWGDDTIQNVLKLKEDIEQYDLEARDIVSECAKSVENKDNIAEMKRREKKELKIRQLRLEGEVIEIIGEIVGCLNVKSADCDRAIELLERMNSHELNTLILKKHPEVVETVRKLRSYVGNIQEWEMTEDEVAEFKMKALTIRQKSRTIYESFKALFCTTEKPFHVQFDEEVQKFNKQVETEGFSAKETLALTSELNGKV